MASITPDTSNTLFQLAAELVNQSSRNIFLTGKAGTGKTTFLKYIRENCPKQMAVVAPTGVAAINAGGVTIHSFFQLPFAPFIPEPAKFSESDEEIVSKGSLLKRLRISGEKLKVLRQLELLIIDEISMVRCDTLDAIDTVLRHVRKRPLERFGGLQVLFIGDMFQLPPVIREQEWKFLADYYNSPYFFDSTVIREEPPLYIEFTKIYRQSEELFIKVLNQVRNNELDEEGRNILERRVHPAMLRSRQDGFIVLTTHNEKARDINSYELKQLSGKTYTYKANIKDEFPSNAFPADEILYLKEGAQVMFIKNDSEKARRYFNGKIGIVTKLEDDKITVKCKDDAEEIEVKPETWKNIRYTINRSTREVDEDELGSFAQYPLRLAWAITIHKSQGLTFEKAIIDAGEAFAAGQVYVALSRCTSLDGMILQSRIRPGSLFVDNRIVQFAQRCASQNMLEQELVVGKRKYQQAILLSSFDFTAEITGINELKEYMDEHASSFNGEVFTWINEILANLDRMQATAVKFHSWLKTQLQLVTPPEENEVLQTKIKDGASHFAKEIQRVVQLLQQAPAITDSRLHAKEFNESTKEIFIGLSRTNFLLGGFDGKWDGETWHKKKKNFVAPPFYVNAYAGSSEKKIQSEHPQLLQQLRKLRDSICARKDLPIYLVAGSSTLEEMVSFLPQTPDELEQIKGFGKVKVENYGQQFLEIIQEYCAENQLSSRIAEKEAKAKSKERVKATAKTKEKPAPRPDTKSESFRLYKEGRTIADIARSRNLAIQTIENHLVHYVQTGEIDIDELVSADKVSLIEGVIQDFDGSSLTAIKEKLGNDIGFGEIKLVMASSAFKRTTQGNNDTARDKLSG